MWVFLIAVANVIGSLAIQYGAKWYNLRKMSMQKSVKMESIYADSYQGLLQAIKDLEDENIGYSRLIISTEKRYNKEIQQKEQSINNLTEVANCLVKVLKEEDIEIPDSLIEKLKNNKIN